MQGTNPFREKDFLTPGQAILKTKLRRLLLWELLPLQPPAAVLDGESTELPRLR